MYGLPAVLWDGISSVSGRGTGRTDVSSGHVLGSFQPGDFVPSTGLRSSPGEPPHMAPYHGGEVQSALVLNRSIPKGG